MKLLRVLLLPSLILIGLLIACLITYFVAPPSTEWLRNLALNLVTEILGILLTVAFIDRVLRAREESEEYERRIKYQTIALRHLRIPLLNHLRMFTNIFRAVSESAPVKPYESTHDLFDRVYFTNLPLLDFSKDAPLLGQKWSDYLTRECSRFKESLTRTLDRYSLYLDSNLVELMEQIINSSFFDFVATAPITREVNQRLRPGVALPSNFFAERSLYGGAINITRKYTDRFSRLLDYYNECESPERKIKPDDHYWSHTVGPRYGSARIDQNKH
jgi:hypothetical protein